MALIVVAGCSTVPLVDPAPIPAAASAATTRVAIQRALKRQHYWVDGEEPGKIRARLQRSDWSMSVDVIYGQTIEIRYAVSNAIDYQIKKGVPYIHAGYNEHVRQLMGEIRSELQFVTEIPEIPKPVPAAETSPAKSETPP